MVLAGRKLKRTVSRCFHFLDLLSCFIVDFWIPFAFPAWEILNRVIWGFSVE